MGKYTVIAEVGQALVRLLQDNMCDEFDLALDAIGLCAPSDKSDFVLGIHLYDVQESKEVRGNAMISQGFSAQRYPSLYLTLSYMITAYSKANVKIRAEVNQRMLGKVIQTMQDHPILSTEVLSPGNRGSGLDLHIEMSGMNMEEQQRIWGASQQPYQTSLFYQVGPVEMESSRTRQIQRVVGVDMGVKE